MFELIATFFEQQVPSLRLFHYITLRGSAALLTSLFFSLWCTPKVIAFLRSRQTEQPLLKYMDPTHKANKQGTPTMGGVVILLSIVISTLLWGDVTNAFIWIALFVTLGYGLIGFQDDFQKVAQRKNDGMRARTKFLAQIGIGIVAALLIQQFGEATVTNRLEFPFFKDLFLDLGWFFLPWAALVMVGASNAVNLTDGLDGLAIGPIVVATGCFCIISYIVGNVAFSKYLFLTHVALAGELSVFCAALVGSGLGFLWFNAPPAKIFMGDTGSLALGGALGAISVMTKNEIVLAIVGGLFVLETLSVVIQVAYFKRTQKRIFLMAPIHHHFEKKGWSEPTIVIRFWIIAIVLGLIGLATLKLR